MMNAIRRVDIQKTRLSLRGSVGGGLTLNSDLSRELMKRSLLTLVPLLSVGAFSMCVAIPSASAEPEPVGPDQTVVSAETATAAEGFAPAPEAPNPTGDACKSFSEALDLAATNYEEFAYATAGNGDYVNYGDPNVQRANIIGRAALQEAATSAMAASRIAGLPPEVSDPIRDWSLHATKLVFVMGLRLGGNSLNNAANQLNADADRAQLACAAALVGG